MTMNCSDFQEQAYEYLEGTLSRSDQSAAAEHLRVCAVCRALLAREQEIALTLNERLQQSSERLTLSPMVQNRILAKLSDRPEPHESANFFNRWWKRFAWLSASTAVLALMALLMFSLHHAGRSPEKKTARIEPPKVRVPISIQLAVVEPIYVFHREGNLVTDVLIYRTNFVEETLQASRD